MNQKRATIAEKAQELLAEKIEEYVTELFEKFIAEEDLTFADEEEIEAEVEDIFERWKDEIENSARVAFEHPNKIHEAIWGGFGHMDYCIDTAREIAERIMDEDF